MTRDEKERLLLSVLPFIRQQTERFCRRTQMSYEDMLQESLLAAWCALERFDPSLSSICTFTSLVIGQHLVKQFQRSIQPRRKPEGHYLRSLNLAGDDGKELANAVPDSHREWSLAAFEELTEPCRPRDREIMRAIYVDGLTQEEIGQKQGCSHQCIGQIHRRAMTAIKRRASDHHGG